MKAFAKKIVLAISVALVTTGSTFVISAQGITREIIETVTGGVITLYANDPLGQTLCFSDGKPGSVLQQREIRNRCSHISFNSYTKDGFTVAIQGGNLGAIVDLGKSDELARKYGYHETVAQGQGYASIHKQNEKFLVLKKGTSRDGKTFQELTGAIPLAQVSSYSQSSPVALGHIYLARVIDKYDKEFDLSVKLIVIAHTPNESVTFRWEIL